MPSNATGTTTKPIQYIKTIPMPSHNVIWRSTHTASLIISPLGGDEWCALRPGRFTPRGKYHSADWIRGCGGGSRCGHLGEEKNLFPLPRIEPRFLGCPGRSLVTMLIELPPFLPKTVQTIYYKLCPLFYFVINTSIRMRERLLQQLH